MKIGTREVGPGHPAFIIAECGSNHGGSLDAALALIDAAAEAGADAAKFQFFRVDRFIVPRENPESLRRYELPEDWLPYLLDRCARHKIEFLCTAFDLISLDVVDRFVNAHKIGSWEQRQSSEFVSAAHRKGKPVIASGGIGWGINTTGDAFIDIALFCRSEYPAKIDGYLSEVAPTNRNGVYSDFGSYMHQTFHAAWGVSDHTLNPTIVPCAAVALGACVVEKHMRHTMGVAPDRSPDYRHSIDEIAFATMVRAIRDTESALGLP